MNEIIQMIKSADHIVVVSHLNPDADSIGSASAMYSFLLQNHKKVSWFCKTEIIDQKLSCVPWFEKIRTSFPSSADLAISLDCADKKRLGIEIECDLINIDHHAGNTFYGSVNFVKADFISTTEILYDFFTTNGVKINKKMATALYAGLLDDSDAFLSDRVDGTTFANVKTLIELGADFKLCNKNIMKSISLAALRLKAIMFKNMSLECDGRVALFCVSDEEMRASGAVADDCEAPLEESLNLAYVEVALLLRQNSDFTIKGSLRSKSSADVGKIASKVGGGGHAYRAGFDLNSTLSLEEAKNKVLILIKKGFLV
ncbi:MAG: bifunctional oligoribonuclease/PAP phosphatase NrnA [Sulfurimonas sp.]|uniref:DHH family phosphoesterase n=1 Tax=Sulfurimonas sp. TaxID=2022749 RepID=UPI002631AF8D|nr:bifunctional oligoribonuclease/PAP phosphatase NrnA [Sulfurimonas sp.]MDD5400227.1 bifunctional oligoribonuclease/PAP phosphatase NrnA [Sulfurimonas sp.]